MTGTERHAPRGTAGRGPNWDRGLRADHAGAARRCTKQHRRLWAQPGPLAMHGPRELRVDACTSRHRRPRDPLGIAGRKRAGGAARLGAGATRRRMHISAPPAARPFWDRGLRAGRRGCATRSGLGPTRLRMPISAPPAAGPARGPWAASGPEELRDSEWSHGCRRDAVTVCFQYPAPEVTVLVT